LKAWPELWRRRNAHRPTDNTERNATRAGAGGGGRSTQREGKAPTDRPNERTGNDLLAPPTFLSLADSEPSSHSQQQQQQQPAAAAAACTWHMSASLCSTGRQAGIVDNDNTSTSSVDVRLISGEQLHGHHQPSSHASQPCQPAARRQ